MKHLCCNRLVLLLFVLVATLQASLHDKSAIIYLGEKISYPMVGIHNYIIVDPKKTNVYTHGFKVYNKKIYAQILITSKDDAKKILQKIEALHKQGFKNFYINAQKGSNKQVIALLNILKIQKEFQNTNILLHPTKTLQFSNILNSFNGIVLYNAQKNQNLVKTIKKLKQFTNTIIDIETTTSDQTDKKRIEYLHKLGLIGYITNNAQNIYGYGIKNAIKREILTLIDDTKKDITILPSHQIGALPLEYQGYIQTLYNINKKGLPDPEQMTQYAGVVVWLTIDYKDPDKLISWIKKLHKHNIYVAFASSFGFNDSMLLQELGIETKDSQENVQRRIIHKDPIMDFEIKSSISNETLYFSPPIGSKALFTYKDTNGDTSTPVAITPWGGYALFDNFIADIGNENMWVINPFEYFKQALRLKPLPVPDPTTENGSRLFFTHTDGDGYVSRVEFNPEKLSGEMIYTEILKKYKIPFSISFIGAEVLPNGLYPKLSKRCLTTLKKIYALPNVEPATHTFTHTFFWGKIKNGNLKPEYRLKPKGYKYSISYETKGMLDFINKNLLNKNKQKKAKTVFWSGDCAPRKNVLSFIYKHNILNINGGDTTINNTEPWLALVAPLGLARGEYYQIYTGEQNENVFTNDWLGPFWGFKKVVQTFKLTNRPRRLKPIDVYYHLYSGSKKASLNALRYVFDWVLKQPNIMPIFTSSYIPKVMDYYTVSMANEGDNWLIDGMRDLKTVRLETKKQHINYVNSPTTVGEKRFNNRTYIAFNPQQSHFISLVTKQENTNYLVSANAKLVQTIHKNKTNRYIFAGEVDLKLTYHLKKGCTLQTTPKAKLVKKSNNNYLLEFPKNRHKGIVDVQCQ